MSKDVLVSLQNIHFSYSNEVILNGIFLDIYDNEFITLLGPSGCGKTTTLRIIAGFEKPESGDVLYKGKVINNLPPYKRNVNTVFQKYSLFPHLNVYDNVAFGLKLKKLSKDEIRNKVNEMLAVVDLKGYESRSVNQLSGGQQQRVAIARALVCDPDIVLLDEPLGALDLKLRKDMQIELKEIQKKTKKTFVYVTHDQEEALTMSDRVVVINNGVIAQVGTPQDVYNEPANAFVADFIGEANIFNGRTLNDGIVKILDKELQSVDYDFEYREHVDVVIRPEDVEVVSPESAQITGIVEDIIFKGVHYEIQVRSDDYLWLIHSTIPQEKGKLIGINVIPSNIHVMKKLFNSSKNRFVAEVTWSDKDENVTYISLEDREIKIPDKYYEKGTKLKFTLTPNDLYIPGDGNGDLEEVYIESVIWKGNHNDIILESDNQKWLMYTDIDEQVSTYVSLCFDFTNAKIEVLEED